MTADDLREQRKFVHEWLWESKTRKTTGMSWSASYVEDAAQMVAVYAAWQTEKSLARLAEAEVLLLESKAMCEDGDGLIDSEKLAARIDAFLEKPK